MSPADLFACRWPASWGGRGPGRSQVSALSTCLPPWLCVPGLLVSVSELRLLFCEGPRWGREGQGANTRSACLGQLFKTRCDLVGGRLAGASRRGAAPSAGRGRDSAAPGVLQGGWAPAFGLRTPAYLCGFCLSLHPHLPLATPHFYLSILLGGWPPRRASGKKCPPRTPLLTSRGHHCAASLTPHSCGTVFLAHHLKD